MFLIFILLFYIFIHHFEGHSTVANKKQKGKKRIKFDCTHKARSSGVVLGVVLDLCGVA